MSNRIGIVGAGMAGAWLAHQLHQAGCEVVVFEKSRGLGGRMTTRRRDDITFDHGAQFFTARTDAFKTLLQAYSHSVIDWQPKVMTLGDKKKPYKRDWFEPHFVGVPGMGALCRALLDDVSVKLSFEVNALQQTDRGWQVFSQNGERVKVDWLVSTAPAEQTKRLINAAPLDAIKYDPCFALMAYLETTPSFDAAVIKNSPLEWVAMTASRPERLATPGIVALSNPEWSRAHFEMDREDVTAHLTTALSDLSIQVQSIAALHRWRYARVATPYTEPFWLDDQNNIGACGDWGIGSTVEDAFTSANSLLDQMQKLL